MISSSIFYIRSIVVIALALLTTYACNTADEALTEHPLAKLEGVTGQWTWVDIDEMTCRDGSSTGIIVRFGESSSKWVIYLMGGGACFTPSTCSGNPSSFGPADFQQNVSSGYYDGGILNITREENPVKDWNFLFVPYCTGDVHSGSNNNSYGLGLAEPQQFVGHENMRFLMKWLKPYFDARNTDEILLAGISAGGFGTHLTYYALKEQFADVQTHVINDSGPLFGNDDIFPACLQLGFQLIYDIPLPGGFLFCCQPSYGLADIYTLSARNYPEDNFGLSSFWEDDINRFFYAAGQNTCSGGEVRGSLYRESLEYLRDDILIPSGKYSTFFVEGDGHTFIQTNSRFYEIEAGGKRYYEWIADVMSGNVQHLE
jgi:hypothetical protein